MVSDAIGPYDRCLSYASVIQFPLSINEDLRRAFKHSKRERNNKIKLKAPLLVSTHLFWVLLPFFQAIVSTLLWNIIAFCTFMRRLWEGCCYLVIYSQSCLTASLLTVKIYCGLRSTRRPFCVPSTNSGFDLYVLCNVASDHVLCFTTCAFHIIKPLGSLEVPCIPLPGCSSFPCRRPTDILGADRWHICFGSLHLPQTWHN